MTWNPLSQKLPKNLGQKGNYKRKALRIKKTLFCWKRTEAEIKHRHFSVPEFLFCQFQNIVVSRLNINRIFQSIWSEWRFPVKLILWQQSSIHRQRGTNSFTFSTQSIILWLIEDKQQKLWLQFEISDASGEGESMIAGTLQCVDHSPTAAGSPPPAPGCESSSSSSRSSFLVLSLIFQGKITLAESWISIFFLS